VQRAEWGVRLAKSNTGQGVVRSSEIQNAEAGVAQAKAGIAQAQSARNTATAAIAQASAGIQSAQATIRSATAAAQLARDNVTKTAIPSPIAGIIATRRAEVGQMAAPGGTLLTVVALNNMFFEAQVSETAFTLLRPGMPVEVTVDAQAGKSFGGRVARLYPTGDANSRAFRVRVEVPNASGTLRPGMFARGTVVLEQRRGVVVSKDAVVEDESGQRVVYVVGADKKATKRPVKIGVQTTTTTEILEGVEQGEFVITTGQGGVKNGTPVSVQEEKKRVAEG
jgi:RND family efflux transporter MFP subunit